MRLLFLAITLTGCAVINPDYYRTMPTAQICHGLMVYPPWNVNHSARWAELERRGASCGHPGDIAASQRAAEGQLMDSYRTLNPAGKTTSCVWREDPARKGWMVCKDH